MKYIALLFITQNVRMYTVRERMEDGWAAHIRVDVRGGDTSRLMAKALDNSIEVSKFPSRYYVHLQIISTGKCMNPLIPTRAMG